MTKEDKQIIDRATKEEWRIGDRTRLKHLLEKNLKLYRENVELEKENEKLKNRNAELKGMYAHSAREAGTYKQFFEQLKKENAELKAKNKWYSEQVCNKECAEVWGNLTKAKEIIKGLLSCCRNYPQENAEKIKQAEQFIKENK